MADKEPSKPARELASQIERDGGQVLALYQEPVGDHWQIFCLLPRTKCPSCHRADAVETLNRFGRTYLYCPSCEHSWTVTRASAASSPSRACS